MGDFTSGLKKWIVPMVTLCAAITVCAALAIEQQRKIEPTETKTELEEQERLQAEAEKAAKPGKYAFTESEATAVTLPADTSQKWTVKELYISGNKLISTSDLLKNIPMIYNSSNLNLADAPRENLYDFRAIRDAVLTPGRPQEISARTIKGFTQYLLSLYGEKGFSGIYVYVPAEITKAGKELPNGVLLLNIIEAPVTTVTVKSYDIERKEKPKGYLRSSAVKAWSPVEPNGIASQKKLDNFVNLLNLNPDRYVSAVISEGNEPNSLALQYDIIESNPWHWFAQIDNAGTDEQQWTPRIGLINTDLLGYDDIFTAVYQAKPDNSIEDNYAIYGSYDFPLLGPALRLNLYGGYGQFDTTPPDGDIGFLGKGSFYGGQLRYNVFQLDKWFFDLTGSLSQERSKNTPSLFPDDLGSDVRMDLLGYGFDIHRRNDMKETSFTFERVSGIGGSHQHEFDLARTGCERDFSFDTFAAAHKRYLDPNKVNNLIGTLRIVYAENRLPPAKMSVFGGMYTVRGYEESEIIADDGILGSLQYEFDLVKYYQPKETPKNNNTPLPDSKKPLFRKLAPLAFVDYGLAEIKDPQAGEDKSQTLLSTGVGLTADVGDNFTGVLYYGIALKSTSRTDNGDGRVNVGLLARW